MLQINITDNIATYLKRGGRIVCGNTGYQVQFTFDATWNNVSNKFARFIWNGEYTDVAISSTGLANVPIIDNTDVCLVGVYASDRYTTTPAKVPCYRSIRDYSTTQRKD